MLLDEIIINKNMKMARASYLYTIVELFEGRRSRGGHKPSQRFLESIKDNDFTIIGEFRKASPEYGLDCSVWDISCAAKTLGEVSDAVCVHTEEVFYHGDDSFVKTAVKKAGKPVIERDFVISPLQIFSAKILGAAAVTLTVKILTLAELLEYKHIVTGIDIDAIAEVTDEEDLRKALKASYNMILINCTNYEDFKTDINAIIKLRRHIPKGIKVFADCPVYDERTLSIIRNEGIDGIFAGADLLHHENEAKRILEIKSLYNQLSTA